MADKPILFSAPMVRALLDGRKTQTRRLLSRPRWADPRAEIEVDEHGHALIVCNSTGCLAGIPLRFVKGDRLWVRETWRTGKSLDDASPTKIATMCAAAGWKRPWCPIKYEADGATVNADALRDFGGEWGKTRVAIHMPRWASRLTDTVTDVRVQRLQEISKDDAAAEGLIKLPATGRYVVNKGDQYFGAAEFDPRFTYRRLWEAINGDGSWDANPWIVALTFTVEKRNIDHG
jgi:hypothetical protein